MATSTATGASSREGTAKAAVADQISQAVQSTSNLLHLMQQSSASQAQLMKLPKNLLAKSATIKNTGQVLQQMPQVISSLDAHVEKGLQSVPHLGTVVQLLANMERNQLSSLSQVNLPKEEIRRSFCISDQKSLKKSVGLFELYKNKEEKRDRQFEDRQRNHEQSFA